MHVCSVHARIVTLDYHERRTKPAPPGPTWIRRDLWSRQPMTRISRNVCSFILFCRADMRGCLCTSVASEVDAFRADNWLPVQRDCSVVGASMVLMRQRMDSGLVRWSPRATGPASGAGRGARWRGSPPAAVAALPALPAVVVVRVLDVGVVVAADTEHGEHVSGAALPSPEPRWLLFLRSAWTGRRVTGAMLE